MMDQNLTPPEHIDRAVEELLSIIASLPPEKILEGRCLTAEMIVPASIKDFRARLVEGLPKDWAVLRIKLARSRSYKEPFMRVTLSYRLVDYYKRAVS